MKYITNGIIGGLVIFLGACSGRTATLPYEKVVRIEGTLLVTPETDSATLKALFLEPVTKKTGTKIEKYICSGGFISPTGDIITAKHCTPVGAELMVETYNGQEYMGEVTRRSAHHDLALIHIAKFQTPCFGAPPSVPGEGAFVAILGTPLGIPWVYAEGHIAKAGGDNTFVDMSVLPGNSGGVVFDADGNAVGVAVAVCVVGFGVTHLGVLESLESMADFIQGR